MNYLDELLALYPGRDWYAQRYFLSHLSTLGPGLESDSLLEFLLGETASPKAPLRHMARRQLGRVFPACLRQAYGLEEAKLGIWTTFALGGAAEAREAAQAVPADVYERLMAAAWHRLAPSLARITSLMGAGSPRLRTAASLVAGRIQTRSGLAGLASGLIARGKLSFPHAAALADLGGAEATFPLLAVARDVGARVPDLLMLLTDVPAAQSVPVLASAERRADAVGASGIALALSHEPGQAGRELLAKLLSRGDGWVSAYALDALSVAPEPADLALAVKLYERAPQEFLKVLAVKLAGGVPGGDAIGFLSDALAQGVPRVRAAALEALARKKVDPVSLARAAAQCVNSPLLKLKVNALLVLARTEPQGALGALTSLIESNEAVQRVEGAYVLGYLRTPVAAQVLGDMALSDPRTPVRLQAIKSLTKHDPAQVVPALAKAAGVGSGRVAALAARALASLPEDAMPVVIAALEPLSSSPHRAVIVRALGIAASRSPAAALPRAVEAALEGADAVLFGALEGAKCLGGAPRVGKLLAHDDPRVRYRASIAAFLAGRLEAAETLDAMLGSGAEDQVLTGLQGLLELATLLPCAVAAPRFDGLRAALDPASRGKDCAAFTLEEKPRAPVELAARPAQRPPGAAARWDAVACEMPLKSPGAPHPGRSQKVRPASKAMDSPLARGNVEGATYLAGLPAGPAAWKELFDSYRGLVLAGAALLIPVFIVMLNFRRAAEAAQSGPGKPLAAGSLRISELKGVATRGPAGKPGGAATLRTHLAPGEAVKTALQTRLMLSDGRGNAVCLGEASRIALGVAAREALAKATTAYVLTDAAGDVLVDFRAADVEGRKGIEVVLAGERVVGTSFTVRIVDTGAERRLTVVDGEPLLHRDDGTERPLKKGDELQLKAESP